jgi:hypothetical protein
MARKLIVTSESGLKAKYDEAGWKKIEKAVQALVKGDAARGVETSVVFLDGLGKKGVKKTAKKSAKSPDPEPFKTAIDQAFTEAERPEYLVILGGPDVVPHQSLRNPAGDEDPVVPSDVPYACEAKAGDKIERFVAASRAVGRIPDLPETKDPRLLVGLLKRAAEWSPLTKTAYAKFFGLSAAQWQKSTTLSLKAIFGKSATSRLSPKDGPGWKSADLSSRAHFINCHGAQSDPQFYGQLGKIYPPAHDAAKLKGLVKAGTVVAAECCYGAELYAPGNGTAGICATYLDEGAIGFLGSTTIAYGPADSNGSADLVCRYFMEAVLAGDSLGKALLVARQRFAKDAAPLHPIDLKTIAQFYLLGDPSLHAISTPATKAVTKAKAVAKGNAKGRAVLSAPRGDLESRAADIAGDLECVDTDAHRSAPDAMAAELEAAARKEGLVPASTAKTYEVRRPEGPAPKGLGPMALLESASLETKAPTGTRFHMMFAEDPGLYESVEGKSLGDSPRKGQITKKLCLLAREVGGTVREIERLWARTGGQGEGTVRRTRRAKALRRGLQERPRGRRPPD